MPTPLPNDTVRAFVGLPLDATVIGELKHLQQSLQSRLKTQAVRWVRPDQLHLTLKFFGNLAKTDVPTVEAALRQTCQGTPPFALQTEYLGCFPQVKNPRVIWIGLTGDVPALLRLQTLLAQATTAWGDHREEREFQPHLTLGRVKNASFQEAREIGEVVQSAAKATRSGWQAQGLEFMQSQLTPQGPIYKVLASIPLSA